MDTHEFQSSDRLISLHQSYKMRGLSLPEAAEYLELGADPISYQGLPGDQAHDIEQSVREVRQIFPPAR